MNGFTKGTCPAPTHIVNIEFQSKDGLVGYQDNYVLPPYQRNRIVRACTPPLQQVYQQMYEQHLQAQQAFVTRTYEDTGRCCPDCGRRIFKEM